MAGCFSPLIDSAHMLPLECPTYTPQKPERFSFEGRVEGYTVEKGVIGIRTVVAATGQQTTFMCDVSNMSISELEAATLQLDSVIESRKAARIEYEKQRT